MISHVLEIAARATVGLATDCLSIDRRRPGWTACTEPNTQHGDDET
jgi:hypothetical protein